MKRWHRWLALLAGATLLAFCGSAVAQAQGTVAGHFFIVVGEIRLTGVDGVRRPAARGSEVRTGDTIVTEANALAQIRLIDGGLVSVRASTEMRLDELSFAGENDSKASMVLSLLKGGFRSITGLIARANRAGYRITTPSATIGIRGTDHEPFVQVPMPPSATPMVPPDATPPVPPGTYDYVREGQTVMRNSEGFTQLIGANQVGFIGVAPGARPVLLPALPMIYRTETPRPGAAGNAQKPAAGTGPAEHKAGNDKPAAAGPGAPRQPGGEGRESPRGTPMDSPRGTPMDSPRGTPMDSPRGTPMDSPRGTPMDSPQGTPMDSPRGTPMDLPRGTPMDSPRGTPMDSPRGTPLDSPQPPSQQRAPLQQTTPLQQGSPTQPQSAPMQQTPPIQQVSPVQPVTPIQQAVPIQQQAPTTISPIIQTTPTTPLQPVPGGIR